MRSKAGLTEYMKRQASASPRVRRLSIQAEFCTRKMHQAHFFSMLRAAHHMGKLLSIVLAQCQQCESAQDFKSTIKSETNIFCICAFALAFVHSTGVFADVKATDGGVTLRSLRMRSCRSCSWRVSAARLSRRRSLASSSSPLS